MSPGIADKQRRRHIEGRENLRLSDYALAQDVLDKGTMTKQKARRAAGWQPAYTARKSEKTPTAW